MLSWNPLLRAFLLLAGATGVLAGAALLALAGRRERLDFIRRILEARVTEVLDTACSIERRVYRHHRAAGAALVAAALAWLWLLAPLEGLRGLWTLLLPYLPLLGIVLLALAVLAAGLVLLLRPSLLKPVERVANRWITVWPEPETMQDQAAGTWVRQVLERPRLSGAILLAAGAVCCWGALHLAGR